jgi:hypothetical protein
MERDVVERLEVARTFLRTVNLDDLVSHALEIKASGPTLELAVGKDQALVAGGGIVSFTQGVTPARRKALTHSALLAQLVANQRVKDSARVAEWYEAYFDVLTKLGWVLQSKNMSVFNAKSDQADVHDAVLDIAAGILGGPATSAFRLVKVSLEALRRIDSATPWISLFRKESEHASTARFQITLAQEGRNADFVVALMAFSLEASSTVKQVLFFKFKSESATLKQYSGSVSMDDDVLLEIDEDVRAKVASFVRDYIKELPDLSPAPVK